MRQPRSTSMIVENGTSAPFPSAVEGRAARPDTPPANDNRRSLKMALRQGLGRFWRVLPPLVGAGVIIYAMTH